MTTLAAKVALSALQECRSNIVEARSDATAAAELLADARKARAAELAELLADALAFVERLSFIVEGDQRADEA